MMTDRKYDVISSEPSNPWIAGVASLFSVDHYQRCAARLSPGGIVTQWLQIYAAHLEAHGRQIERTLAAWQAAAR